MIDGNAVPLMLLCDTSGSMAGTPIQNVNASVQAFLERIRREKQMVDLCVIGFNRTTQVLQDWHSVKDIAPVAFRAGGGTNLAAALETAMDKIREYIRTHTAAPSPILILISDGYGGDISHISPKVRQWVESGKMQLRVLAIKGYDMETVATLTEGEDVFELTEEGAYDFSDFFRLMGENLVATANGTSANAPNLQGTNLRRPDFTQWLKS